MIDDTLCVVECGYKTNQMVAYLNSQASFKNLIFGIKKCFKIHVGKRRQDYMCSDIKLDCWNIKEVECLQTGSVELQEDFVGGRKIKEVKQEKYLGDLISADGTNKDTVKDRCNKSIGVITKIESMLKNLVFGK